jgi:hemolysin activation/secretion protein
MNTKQINKRLWQEGCWLLPCMIIFLNSIEPSCAQTRIESFEAPSIAPSVAQDRPRSRQPNSAPFNPPTLPSEEFPPLPSPQPLPQPPIEDQLPPPDQLLPQPQPSQPLTPGDIPSTIRVQRFEVVGSTVFTPEELAAVTDPYVGQALSFAELLQVRSAITQLYVDQGYITSGAVIPPQTIAEGVVTIQVVEGRLDAINVTGTRRLNSSYIRSRLALAGSEPLNVDRLLEGLQLLQLNPLIETISADLQTGIEPGTSVLQVQVTEADTFRVDLAIDNDRSPSVGSFQRQIQFNQANLTGLGDELIFSYANTDGSNELSGSYTLPLNPRNGTLQFAAGYVHSHVIEPPFDRLDIEAVSRYYELTLRQPVFQSPSEEFVLGLVASRQESDTELLNQPFPLSAGANDEGETRISALRFFQEWVKRSSTDVVAVRSQVSLGVDVLNATVNDDAPDSRFFAWRGQAQWVHLLAPDTLVLVRGDVQIADSPLVPLEQFGLGGAQTIRGYRQDFLLTDSGVQASAEVRLPVLRVPEVEGLLQVAPFFDLGTAWNADGVNPEPSSLFGLGIGLLWQQGDTLSARLDFGMPLVSVESRERTWQESGVYFSVQYSPF